MSIKPGGLLERVLKRAEAEAAARTCETCGNLIKIGETALGCTVRDKLIIPGYFPYHGIMRCADWAPKNSGEETR